MEEVRYMISEASKRVGVESHTLRYWEEELDLPVKRNEMGHRYYKESDIELFKTIKKLKEQGFQLKAIKLLLPDLKKLDSLDNNTMIKLKEELNGKVDEMWTDNNISEMEKDKEKETSLIANKENDEIEKENKDKMSQFKAIMNQIIMSALKENNAELSEEISSTVTDNVIKEMHYLMRLQEEREEERFRKFDATLREYQKSRLHAAAVLEGKGRKKSKFFRKHKIYI
ncbi:MAG TPA: helix-turn-helix domain-containing protein [Mobilitalea sp.]|nr:helix-turn-helix domain-containing protein [Mobilitalea sp.]